MNFSFAAALALSMTLVSCVEAPAAPPATSSGASSNQGSRLAVNDDLQCRVLTDVAEQLGSDSFIAYLTPIDDSQRATDCTAAFQAAGIPITPFGNPHDPRVNNTAVDHAWRFAAPQFTDDDAATVTVDYICRRLCGHGEKLTLKRLGSTWKIVQRETTWVS